ncbi:Palmitoyl-protein thioesterase 1, partial [Coemansia sp. RSA 1933]
MVEATAATRANEVKLEANALYAKKQYHEAIAKYTAAIELDATVPAFYTNRAQCHLFTEGYGAAKADADAALSIDPSFIKAYYRRASANLAMGKLKEARADFREVTKRQPNDAGARNKYVECDKLYRRIQFERAIDSEADRKRVADTIDLNSFAISEDYKGPRMPIRKKRVSKKSGKEVVEDGADEETVEVDEEYVDLDFVKGVMELFRDQKTLP